jgi:hypothetical protein
MSRKKFVEQPPKDLEVHYVTPFKTLWSWSVARNSANRAIEFETNSRNEVWVTAKGLKWKIVQFSVMPVNKAQMLVSDVKRRIGENAKRMTSWEQTFQFTTAYETAPQIGHIILQTEMIKNVTVEEKMGNKVVRKVARQIVKPVMKLNLRVPVDLLENALYTGKYERFLTIPNRYTFKEQKLRF